MRWLAESLAVALVAILLSPTQMLAQNIAPTVWQGVLRDAAGSPMHDAAVHLKGKNGNIDATTGEDGHFRFEGVAPGTYRLSVELDHHIVPYAQTINLSGPAQPVALTFTDQQSLSVSTLTEQHAATGGEALSSQTVSELPLNKRDFSQLLLLAAGTMTDTNGATNFTQQFAINGQRGVEAVFAMD